MRVRGCNPVSEDIIVAARLLRLHSNVVGPRWQCRCDQLIRRAGFDAAVQHMALGIFQEQVGIGVLLTETESDFFCFRKREPVIVYTVAVAIHRVEGKARPLQIRDVAEIDGTRAHIVGRCIPNLQFVGAQVAARGACRNVISATRRRGENQMAVRAFAAVVVCSACNKIARGIVNASNEGIVKRTVVRAATPQIDRVGMARHELDRKPVPVARVIDLARRRAAHRDRPGRAGCRSEVVSRHRAPL